MKIDISWYSSEKSVFSISTLGQLLGLSSIVSSDGGVIPHDSFGGKTINLMSDIDMTSVADEWVAIGSKESPFEGTFNGYKHKLYGLKTSLSVGINGIFGVTTEDADIRNLIVNAEFYEATTIGGIVAINGGNITNCKFYGSIIGQNGCGGLVGMNTGIIRRSSNYGNIVAKHQYVGGLVGINQNDIGEITDCYNVGLISGTNCVGGITGHNNGTQIKNCFNTGEIKPFEGYDNVECFGGIVGYNSAGCPVKNCYNTPSGKVSCGKYEGGIVGKNLGTISGCCNKGEVTGTSILGGITGGNLNGQLLTNQNKGVVNGKQQAGGIAGENNGGVVQNCNNAAGVNVEFGSVGGLIGFGKWGQITDSSNDGVVRALGAENCGGIIGEIKFGTIKNCTNTGVIVGMARAGGIAGACISRSVIDSCSNLAEVKGSIYVGGLSGYVYGDVKDSYSTASVYGSETFTNIVGYSESGAIQDCYSTGKAINVHGC